MRTLSETWHVAHTITQQEKRDSRLAAYGGVVLQRFEFIKFVWKRNDFAGKVNAAYILWIKSTYQVFLCCSFSCLPAPQADLTRFRRVVVLWVSIATVQHSNRVSRFYSQNISRIDCSSKTVAYPYKPLHPATQHLHMLWGENHVSRSQILLLCNSMCHRLRFAECELRPPVIQHVVFSTKTKAKLYLWIISALQASNGSQISFCNLTNVQTSISEGICPSFEQINISQREDAINLRLHTNY